MPLATEAAEATHTAGRISMGAAEPARSRSMAVVVGMS